MTVDHVFFGDGQERWIVTALGEPVRIFETEGAAIMAQQPTATEEWFNGAQGILDRLRDVLKDARDLQALFEDNPSIYGDILATAAGELVPGTRKSREQIICMGALMQDAATWMDGAVVGNPPHGLENPPKRRAVVMSR
jgi:hypothetical protein